MAPVQIQNHSNHVASAPRREALTRSLAYNARDRRLSLEEQICLLDAARREDQRRSIELSIQALDKDAGAEAAARTSMYASKKTKQAVNAGRGHEASKSYEHVALLETIVQFQLATAARRREALGLTWDRLDFLERTGFLPRIKNGPKRYLSIDSAIVKMLRALPRSSNSVLNIREKELRDSWKRICKAGKLKDLRLEDLRHEAICRAAESGRFPTLRDLQAFTGHHDLRMLSRYTHLMSSAIARRMDI